VGEGRCDQGSSNCKQAGTLTQTGSGTQTAPLVDTSGGEKEPATTHPCVEGVIHDEVEDLLVEMEALEVGGRVVVKKVGG